MKVALQTNPEDPRSIAEGILEAMVEPHGWPDPALLWGAPAVDFTVTLLSLRAGMLGAKTGRTLFHHELRRRLPMAPEGWPEIEVWENNDALIPFWADGVLQEPKYFSFFQDAPFAAFNPNYRRKWRAHEMLHGAVGWFWRGDMTRFEFYLASRINELLPVVHWYAFDEAFRPRCDEHFETVLAREFCQDCEDAARHYWLDPEPDRVDAATAHIARGLEHLNEELEIITREYETLEAISSPRGHIDGSSDAIGYMKGHWNRCTAWSFGAWVEGFHRKTDYFTDIPSMLENTLSTTRELLSGEISYDESEVATMRALRHVQDVAYRCLLRIEADETETYEHAIDPHLHRLADLSWDLARGEATAGEVSPCFDSLRETLEDLTDFHVMARGFDPAEPSSLELLREGVATALPQTVEATENLEYRISAFVETTAFYQNGKLGERFAKWLQSEGDEAAIVASFEAWIAAEPREDSEYELFAHKPPTPEDLKTGKLRLNSTYREMDLAEHEASLLFELHHASKICAVFANGEASVMVLEEPSQKAIAAIIDADRDALLQCEPEVVTSLLETGVLVWLPSVVQ